MTFHQITEIANVTERSTIYMRHSNKEKEKVQEMYNCYDECFSAPQAHGQVGLSYALKFTTGPSRLKWPSKAHYR